MRGVVHQRCERHHDNHHHHHCRRRHRVRCESKSFFGHDAEALTVFAALAAVLQFAIVGQIAIGQGALVSGLPLSTRVVSFGGFAFGYGLQFFWFRKIVQGMIKALGGGSGKKGAKKRA